MKYKTGDEVYDISRDRIGVILSVGEDTYELALDGYDLPLFASENSLILLDDIGRLRAENERLKAALEQIKAYAGVNPYMQDFSIVCDAFSGIRQVLIEIGIMALS